MRLFNYEELTIHQLYGWNILDFECDADSKKINIKPNEEFEKYLEKHSQKKQFHEKDTNEQVFEIKEDEILLSTPVDIRDYELDDE